MYVAESEPGSISGTKIVEGLKSTSEDWCLLRERDENVQRLPFHTFAPRSFHSIIRAETINPPAAHLLEKPEGERGVFFFFFPYRELLM